MMALKLVTILASLVIRSFGFSTVDLSSTPDGGFMDFYGSRQSDYLYASKDSVGDFDGDGLNDIIITNSLFPNNPSYAYVIFGKYLNNTMESVNTDSFTTGLDTGFKLSISNSLFSSGNFLGDVNGDGFDDIGVANPIGSRVYVIFGKNTGIVDLDLDSFTSDKSVGFNVLDGGTGNSCGEFIIGLGDINNDGFDDIGSLCRADTGTLYVVFGKSADSEFADVELSLTSTSIENGLIIKSISETDDRIENFAKIGDFNNDGFSDFVVGTPFADNGATVNVGISYVIFGRSTTGVETIDLATFSASASSGFRIIGETANDRSGFTHAVVPDINGDGLDEYLVGVYGINTLAGAIYVFFGQSTIGTVEDVFFADFLTSDVTGFVIFGATDFDELNKVGSAGDFNGDGFGDLLVAAASADPLERDRAGTSYIIYGKSSGYANIELATFEFTDSTGVIIYGADSGDRCGESVVGVGDVNDGGLDDVMIACRYADPDSISDAGRVFIVYGEGSTAPTSPATLHPTLVPTLSPTTFPTSAPSTPPSIIPTSSPTIVPTLVPTLVPTTPPTSAPSTSPSIIPTCTPTILPTLVPTTSPTLSDRYVWDIAGTGVLGYNGNGKIGTSAQVSTPYDVWRDTNDVIYFADNANNYIRTIDPASAQVNVYAGDGQLGFRGDGDAATKAQFRYPRAVVGDNVNSLYVSDTFNKRIRMVTMDQAYITTVVGGGQDSTSASLQATDAQLNSVVGLHYDETNGVLYFCEPKGNVMRKLTVSDGSLLVVVGSLGAAAGFSGDGGPATSASLNFPFDVTLDTNGNLYVSERDNHCIRKITPAGIITTFAGVCATTGYAGDGGPATDALFSVKIRGIDIDEFGSVHVCDTDSNRIRSIDSNNIIKTVIGTGSNIYNGNGLLATLSNIHTPMGLFITAENEILFTEGNGHRIRGLFFSPPSVAPSPAPTPEGYLPPSITPTVTPTIVPSASGVLQVYTVAGTGRRSFGGDGGDATDAFLRHPVGMWVDQNGDVLIADARNNRIRKVEKANNIISTYAGDGNSTFDGDGGAATSASLKSPRFVMEYEPDVVFVSDTWNHRIRKIENGIIETYVGGGSSFSATDRTSVKLEAPYGLFIDDFTDSSNPQMYICQPYRLNVVLKLDMNTNQLTVFAGILEIDGNVLVENVQATSVGLGNPHAVYVDTMGLVYVADGALNAVRVIDTNGIISTFAGVERLRVPIVGDGLDKNNVVLSPTDVTGDTQGNIFVSDQYTRRIRKIDSVGIITTVVGGGEWAYTQDGRKATDIWLGNRDTKVFLTSNGDIYFSETRRSVVRVARYV